MNRSILRTLACSAFIGVTAVGGVQAQTPAAASSLPDFTGIVQKNAPAVVQVEAKYSGDHQSDMQPSGQIDGQQAQILRRLFGMPTPQSPQEQKHMSLGSGFIISHDGYILTNNHVVADADKVTVRLQDRRTLTAKVVGTDPTYDIALLKVDAGSSLPMVSIGDSHTLKAGQWVLAVGSPFGFDYTVTQGIVSAVGRNLGNQDQPDTSFIQTDVPINRGNSGGPLFNMQGQVVGINSQIYSSTGGYQGVSFSIPIDVAMSAVKQLRTKGYVTRGELGVRVGPVDDDAVRALKLDNDNGALVASVSPDSGAEKGGVQPGDIILGFDGHPIDQGSDLPPLVAITPPGTKAPLEVMRNGKKLTLQVTIGAMPRDKNAKTGDTQDDTSHGGAAALGLTVQSIDSDTRQQLGLKPGQGVAISDITGPIAAQAGLRAGDIVLMVNQQRIGDVAAFSKATADIKPGDTVLLLVRRGNVTNFVGLTVPGKAGGQ